MRKIFIALRQTAACLMRRLTLTLMLATSGVAVAQVGVGGTSGVGGTVSMAFGAVQLNTTKVMTLTLTATDAVTFASPAVIVSTLTDTPFSLKAPVAPATVSEDDGCSGKTLGPVAPAIATCTIAVRYTPTSETTSASYFRVATTAPVAYPGVFVNLTGTGITGGASTESTLSITPVSPFTISAAVGDIPTQLLMLKATGGNVSISGIALPDGWVMNNLCGASIRPDYDCVIMLYPKVPGNAGTYPYKLVFQASDKAHILDVTLNVSETSAGAQSKITLSPTVLNFGGVRPGEKVTQTVTVKASIDSVAFTGLSVPTGFTSSHSCGSLIPKDGTCTAAISFTPTEEISYAGSAVFNTSAEGAPHFVTLTGSGSSAADQQSLLTISPTLLDFGTLKPGGKTTKSFTLTANSTNVALNGINPPTGFTVVHSCGTLIPAGGSCSASITFSPTAKIPYDGSAVIDVTDAPHFITLKGSGGTATSSDGTSTLPALLVLEDSYLDFGDVVTGQSGQKEVALSNRGGTALGASLSLNSSAGAVFTAALGNCGSGATLSLAAGASCTMLLSFSPNTIGAAIGSISFSGVGAEDMAIQLRGNGLADSGGTTAPATSGIVAAASTLSFGSVEVGGSMVKTLTLSSSSGIRPTITSIQAPAGFTASSNCATASTSTCALTVAFVPTSVSTFGGILVVNATDGSAVMITLSGQGSTGSRMSARSGGSKQALDLTGDFRFAAELAGSVGSLYVAALYQDQLFFTAGGLWTAYVPGVEPTAYVLNAGSATELTIMRGQDVSSMPGAMIFLGYGRTFEEVVRNHQYTPVFVVE